MTEEEQKQFNDAIYDYEEYKRERAIKALFEKESISYELKDFNVFIRAFCWLKTLICLVLKRTNGSYLDYDKFCILTYDERYCMESQSWDACWISPYIFKDWNVCLASDGT